MMFVSSIQSGHDVPFPVTLELCAGRSSENGFRIYRFTLIDVSGKNIFRPAKK